MHDIVIVATLMDGTNLVKSTDLEFTVTILDACIFDTISFNSNIGEITYAISTSGTPFSPADAPRYSHTFEKCPVTCGITDADGSPVQPFIQNALGLQLAVNPQPSITIATSDKLYVGLEADLAVFCTSTMSDSNPTQPGNQPSTAVDTFAVKLVDECENTLITPVVWEDKGTFTFQAFQSAFQVSSQNLDCAAPTYELIVVSTTSPDPANCWLDDDTPTVNMNPLERNDAGVYTFIIRTCVPYLTNGPNDITAPSCVDSVQYDLTVTDPCDTAEILSSGFTYVMSKPQL